MSVPMVNVSATPTQHGGVSMMPMIIMLAVLVLFYIWLWRQQSKKAKTQVQFLDSLTQGDEVVTAGGIAGKIGRIDTDYVILRVAKDTEVTLQKSAVSALLPKGTIKNLD